MGENTIVTHISPLAGPSEEAAPECYLCHQSEGDYLFFHPIANQWLHKRCFEAFTCSKKPEDLCN